MVFTKPLKGSIINNVLNARTRQNYKINIEEEMKSSYIDYSMSVIVARALPDVKRRICRFTAVFFTE